MTKTAKGYEEWRNNMSSGYQPRQESHLQVLKTQLAEALSACGWLDNESEAVLPCSPDDLDEIEMLLEDLYPKSNYRAEVVMDPATVVIKRG